MFVAPRQGEQRDDFMLLELASPIVALGKAVVKPLRPMPSG
jgi:hypothetical protein